MESKGAWVYRLTALPDLLALPPDLEQKEGNGKRGRERNQRKRYHTDRDSVMYLYRAWDARSWTFSSSFRPQKESHRQSRRSQSEWQDTKVPASYKKKKSASILECVCCSIWWCGGYSTSFLTDGVCGGGIAGFESTLQKLRGCIT